MGGWRSAVFLLLVQVVEPGTLRIQSEPGAQVLWEGVPVGSTDAQGQITIRDIPVGTFSITVQKEGFRPEQRAVTIQSGSQTLQIALQSLSKAPPERPPSASPAPSPPLEQKSAAAPSAKPAAPPAGRPARESPLPATEDEQAPGPTVIPPAPMATSALEPGPEHPPGESGINLGAAVGDGPVAPIRPAGPERGSPSAVWWVAAGVVLAGAWFLIRHRGALRSGVPAEGSPPLDLPPLPAPPAPTQQDLGFLELLRQREQFLEDGIEMEPARPPKVIDVDAREVRDIEE